MNRFALLIVGIGVATAAMPAAATAAPWASINQRQARLDARIDQGVRAGSLSRREAGYLRGELRQLTQLEYRYRRTGGGLSVGERRDLDRRFDVLSNKVRVDRHDYNGRPGYRR